MDDGVRVVDRPDESTVSTSSTNGGASGTAVRRGRYLLLRGDEELGFAQYERAGGAVTFVHTEVDTARRERGLGSRLVAGALDAERASTTDRVVATCPFVVAFLRSHPEYTDLQTR